ncbi:MAG: inactive transglutaminase family protein [Motiliproteus sp.]
MNSRAQVYLFAILLLVLGSGLTFYKHNSLGFPLTPGELDQVWTIEASVNFDAKGDSIKANLALPDLGGEFEFISESFSSSGFGFDSITEDNGQRRVVWTKRKGNGNQQLYYRLQLVQHEDANRTDKEPPFDEELTAPEWSEAAQGVAQSLIKKAEELSADIPSLTKQLLLQLNDPKSADASFLHDELPNDTTGDLAIKVLTEANIPARQIRGLALVEDRKNIQADEVLEVWGGESWTPFTPADAKQGFPPGFLVWQRSGISMLDVTGGENSRVRFSMISNYLPSKSVAMNSPSRSHVPLLDFSIFTLPVDKQNAFKSILLIPAGILVVVIFRVLIGLKTSGTFMPVLIALAFIQTNLTTGLITFLSIVGVGLWLRSYLSKINLLLVARISVVVIMVIILMAGFSVISYKLGIDELMGITFFPMIIIAWTIERMSILWEEDGPKEVMSQGFGSLLVAVFIYLVMTNGYIQHMTFNFPETLLIEMGVILILGQYSGFRLLELYRFRSLGKGL